MSRSLTEFYSFWYSDEDGIKDCQEPRDTGRLADRSLVPARRNKAARPQWISLCYILVASRWRTFTIHLNRHALSLKVLLGIPSLAAPKQGEERRDQQALAATCSPETPAARLSWHPTRSSWRINLSQPCTVKTSIGL